MAGLPIRPTISKPQVLTLTEDVEVDIDEIKRFLENRRTAGIRFPSDNTARERIMDIVLNVCKWKKNEALSKGNLIYFYK